MIVAAHQPHFLPWLGYLDKLAKVDLFVVMDDLPFEPDNFQHRQRMKLAAGTAWLEVPVVPGASRICDVLVDNATDWRLQLWSTLEAHYADAPYFTPYRDELRFIFEQPWQYLVELDICLLELARSWLRVRTPIVRMSTLEISGEGTDRIVELCRGVHARAYFAGSGRARTELDVEKLVRAGIGVIWQHFDAPEYPQLYPRHGFASHLGFLDLVFNCGANGARDLLFPRSHPLHAAG